MKSVKNTGIAKAMPMPQHIFIILSIAIALFSSSCANKKSLLYLDPVKKDTYTQGTVATKIMKDISFTGLVKDKDGNPMPDVQLLIDKELIGNTNTDGSFTIQKNIDISKMLILTCAKTGYNNTSISYHYQMGSPTYDVKMGKPCICDSIIIDRRFCSCLEGKAFAYNGTITAVIDDELTEIATCLKNNPECSITLNYEFVEDKRRAAAKVDALKTALANKGISETRVVLNTSYNANAQQSRVYVLIQAND